MLKPIQQFLSRISRTGQNMIEYMLVFVGVIVVLIIAVGPNGLLTGHLDRSLDIASQGVVCMALEECYDPAGCGWTANNGCCELGEFPAVGNTDCGCFSDADCYVPEGNFCNGLEKCVLNACQPGTPPSIDDGIACTTDSCNEATDTIEHTPDDSVCDDKKACNGAEYCSITLGCQAGTPLVFDDGVSCTKDDCKDPSGTITHTPDDKICDDKKKCNGAETCDPLNDCQLGTPIPTDDGIACTIDKCNEPSGNVTHTTDDSVCSDGVFCNGAEVCDVNTGGCKPAPLNLDDKVDCTVDSCDEVQDKIVHAPDNAFCQDGKWCNGAEVCAPSGPGKGCSSGIAPNTSDGFSCTADSCDEVNDTVVHAPNDSKCDDSKACNGVETCRPGQGDPLTGCLPGIDTGCGKCLGPAPANAQLCANDDQNVFVDTPRVLVPSCTAAKCEYTCVTGYEYSNGTCIPASRPSTPLSPGPGLPNVTFDAIVHEGVRYVQCPDPKYTGNPNRQCLYGQWQQLNDPCVPGTCQEITLEIGLPNSGLTGKFPTTGLNQSASVTCPTNPLYTGTPTRTCTKDPGTESTNGFGSLSSPCAPASCSQLDLEVGLGPNNKRTYLARAHGQSYNPGCPGGFSGDPTRQCSFGAWGNYVSPCVALSCTGPDGTVIPSGSSKTYYQSGTVACGLLNTCVSQVQTCSNGQLSYSPYQYGYPNCVEAPQNGGWSAPTYSGCIPNNGLCGDGHIDVTKICNNPIPGCGGALCDGWAPANYVWTTTYSGCWTGATPTPCGSYGSQTCCYADCQTASVYIGCNFYMTADAGRNGTQRFWSWDSWQWWDTATVQCNNGGWQIINGCADNGYGPELCSGCAR